MPNFVYFCDSRPRLLSKPSVSVDYYLRYYGIIGDQCPEGGNVLTQRFLRLLPPFASPGVIYGEVSLLDEARLRSEGITFKKIPYELRGW